MDQSLVETLREVLDLAYPQPWHTDWLSLPGDESLPGFNVMCCDTPTAHGIAQDPPSSRSPKVWVQWSPPSGRGFWVRPRKFAPVLRDRLILVESAELMDEERRAAITLPALTDALQFSADSGRIVWHNPQKGGSRSPLSAHFQSMPVHRGEARSRAYTFPCCSMRIHESDWICASHSCWHIIKRQEYPLLGLVVWGPTLQSAELVWSIINDYDAARACNLVVEPDHLSEGDDIVRVFVFPRARRSQKDRVTTDLLRDDEQMLMNNDHGGAWCEWPFAGPEMGLLTQVDWGPLFAEMRASPAKWGKTLIRLAQALSLGETDDDWKAFLDITHKHAERLEARHG